MDAWGLVMLTPADRNLNDLFIEGGLTFSGWHAARPADKAGVAFGYLRTGAAVLKYYKDGFSVGTGLAPSFQRHTTDAIEDEGCARHRRTPRNLVLARGLF